MTSERIKNGQIVWPWPMTAGVLESGRMLPLSRKLHLFESELVFVRRTRSYLVKLVIQKRDVARVVVLASREESSADFCVCTCRDWCSWWVAESS